MIIDSHTHVSKILNSRFDKSYEEILEMLLLEMKRAGVDRSLVIAGLEREGGFNPTTKTLVGLIKGKSEFKAIAGLDVLQYTADDLSALEGWLADKSVVGIKLYTGYQHFYPNDERCTPIYKLCQKYNAPVIFHSGDVLAGYVKNPKIKYSQPILIDDIATDFPELKIVIAHMGNPWLVDCAEVLYKNPNVYADISGLIVGDNFDTPYGIMMLQKTKELISYVGSDFGQFKLIYGTDWPLCPMDVYLKFVKKLGLTKEQEDKLVFGNAQTVFGL